MPKQLPLMLGHRVALGLEDFLVAPSNARAVEWIDRWPDWGFTALVVVGPEDSGKTHLAELWRSRAGAVAIDPTALRLEQAALIATHTQTAMIDGGDRAAGDPAAEIGMLQLYNLLRAAKGQLLVTAVRPPAEWGLALPDLASRLNAAMVVTIDPPDDSLLAAVALKQFADRQVTVGEGVINVILSRGERSFAGVARAIDALDRAALAGRRPITVPLAREVLEGLARN